MKRRFAFAAAALCLAAALAFGWPGGMTPAAFAEGEQGGSNGNAPTSVVPPADDAVLQAAEGDGDGEGDGGDADADGTDGDGAEGEGGNGSTVFPGGNADETLADGSTSVQPSSEEAIEEDERALRKDNLVNLHQLPDSSFIYDTLIADLATADSYLNNQTVQVVGEAVGDRITAEFDSAYCWVALQSLDAPYSQISVYMTRTQADPIDVFGVYGARGTTLQVRGTFHLACPDHQGLTDLHADSVTVVQKGEVIEQRLNVARFIPGIVLTAVGLLLIYAFKRVRERRR